MVKYGSTELDAVFSALGDPTRRAILARLALGESCVTELAAPHEMSLPAVSKHIRVLEAAGLIRKEKDGKVIRCSLNPDNLKGAADWVEHYRHFWESRFNRLARHLESAKPAKEESDE